jgi:hypothetical protein
MKPKNFKLSSIFPSPFAQIEFEEAEEVNRAIHAYTLECERAGKIVRGDDDKTITAWGDCFQIALTKEAPPQINELAQAVRITMGQFLKQIGIESVTGNVRVSGWIVLTRAGGYNAPHAHPHGTFSTIYHAVVPEKPFPQGCLEFINPVGTQAFHSFGSVNEVIPSKAGMLYILPSYLMHFVHPFEGPGERISLNIDFFIEGGPATAMRQDTPANQ